MPRFPSRWPAPLLAVALVTVALVLATPGCRQDAGTSPPRQGRVRIVNAIGNVPSLEAFVDGRMMGETAIAYRGHTMYEALEAGPHQIAVRATGATTDLLALAFEVAGESNQTLVAAGRAGATSGPTPRFIVVPRHPAQLTDEATFRFVHAAPSAGTVDVYITGPVGTLESALPSLEGISFGGVAPPVTMPTGTYRFRVTRAGTKVVVIDVNNLVVGPDVYTAIAFGDLAPEMGTPSAHMLRLIPMSGM